MDEMIAYIFNTMGATKKEFHDIWKHLNRQRGFNTRITLIAAACAAGLYIVERRRREQSKKIDALAKEIEELKVAKGE